MLNDNINSILVLLYIETLDVYIAAQVWLKNHQLLVIKEKKQDPASSSIDLTQPLSVWTMVLCHGSERCCKRLSNGPFPVTLCWTRNPKNANIANLPAYNNTLALGQARKEK